MENNADNMQQLFSHENKNVKLFALTVTDLMLSQGFYGRLQREIVEMSQEDLDKLINTLCEQDFKNTLDVILWLEEL